jgi:hypothetical protein
LFLPQLLLFQELQLQQQGLYRVISLGRFLVLNTVNITPGEPNEFGAGMPAEISRKLGAVLVLHSTHFLQVRNSVKSQVAVAREGPMCTR